MKLDVYSDLRQSTAYASLLDDINRQFLTHADETVLKEASAALLHAKTFEELDEVTGEKLGQLQEETIAVLMACVCGKDVATTRFGDANLTELINTVRRLEYLASITDCREVLESPPTAQIQSKRKGKQPATDEPSGSTKVPVDVLLALLSRGTSLDELEEELIVRVFKVLLFYFMWKVKSLSEEDPYNIAEVDIDDLQERRQNLVLALGRIITSRGHPKECGNDAAGENEPGRIDGMDAVRIAAAGTLLDIYTLFATLQHRVTPGTASANGDVQDVRNENELLTRLVAFSEEMPDDLQRSVLRVFSAAERKFAKAGKRILESSGAEGRESESESEDGGKDKEHDDEEDDEDEETVEESTLLTYEQRLCEYAGRIVLAILGDVVDREKFLKRLARNKLRLGTNFKEVVAHLALVGVEDEAYPAPRKGPGRGVRGGTRAATTPAATTAPEKRGKSNLKSAEEVSSDDEDDEIEEMIVVGTTDAGGDGEGEREGEGRADEPGKSDAGGAEEDAVEPEEAGEGEGEGGAKEDKDEDEDEDEDENEDKDEDEDKDEEQTPPASPPDDEDEEMADA